MLKKLYLVGIKQYFREDEEICAYVFKNRKDAEDKVKNSKLDLCLLEVKVKKEELLTI